MLIITEQGVRNINDPQPVPYWINTRDFTIVQSLARPNEHYDALGNQPEDAAHYIGG